MQGPTLLMGVKSIAGGSLGAGIIAALMESHILLSVVVWQIVMEITRAKWISKSKAQVAVLAPRV